MLRIGEFARLTRVSVRMLRHYDRIGLLRPARVDAATGYRYYRAAQLGTVNRILALREVGFGLDEIAHVLQGDDEAALQRRERDLLTQLEVVSAQLAAVRARRALGQSPTDVVIRSVPAVAVATVRARRGADVGGLFHRLEAYVGSHHARADRPPLTLLDDDVVIVAVPVTRPVPEGRVPAGGAVRTLTLPAVPTMACTIHNGPYRGLVDHLTYMLDWLGHTGRRPAGPLREVYLRFGAEPDLDLPPTHVADDADPDYVTELQLPIREA